MTTIEFVTQEELDNAFEEQMLLQEKKQGLLEAIDRQEDEITDMQDRLEDARQELDDLRDELEGIEEQIIN